MTMDITPHTGKRMRRRGRKESDIEFVYTYGTPCKRGILLSQKDAEQLIRTAKKTIHRATHLKGTFLACEGETVKTVFQATKSQQSRILEDRLD